MFYITHTADVQVKNNKPYLHIPTEMALRTIEDSVRSLMSPVHVIAGDLFEYAKPSLSEQELIYQHLTNLLLIPTLKELVIIAGNHDLVKDKVQTSEERGHNAITTFTNVIENIPFAKEKIRYFSKSGIYTSNVNDQMEYVVYSLEDTDCWEDLKNQVTPGKLQICLYHAMLREYAEYDKLPIPAHVMDKLDSIEMFPANSVIMSGDIHKTLIFEGSENQTFIYPGSPLQHTFSEGTYVTFDGKLKVQRGSDKYLMVYSVHGNQLTDIRRIPYQSEIEYVTVEIKPGNYTAEEILVELNDLDLDFCTAEDGVKTQRPKPTVCIKLKSNNRYIAAEADLIECIKSRILNAYDFHVIVSYDKIKSDIEQRGYVNDLINEITESSDSVSFDTSLDKNSINELSLSNVQLVSLFRNALKTKYPTITENIIEEVVMHFQNELVSTNNNTHARFDIRFESIRTNGFMFLDECEVDLNHEGITRILGTNGIGKTTLYKMIRWVLTDKIHEGMSNSETVKNTKLIFNKNKPDNDFVQVELKLSVNGMPVIIQRSASRRWKENTTDDIKLSNNRDNYISNVTRSLQVYIGDERHISDTEAQREIDTWFGNTVNNLLFLNSSKIESLLNQKPVDIKENIMRYIGVDYLFSMKDNYPKVQQSIFESVTKPKRKAVAISENISQVQENLDSKRQELDENQEYLDVTNVELEKIELSFEKYKEKSYTHNSLTEQLSKLNNELKYWEKKLFKIPELQEEYTEQVDGLKAQINQLNSDISSKQIQLDELIKKGFDQTELDDKKAKFLEGATKIVDAERASVEQNELAPVKTDFDNQQALLSSKRESFESTRKQILEDYHAKQETIKSELNKINTGLERVESLRNETLEKISNKQNLIDGSPCPTCGNKTEKLVQEVIDSYIQELDTLKTNLTKIDTKRDELLETKKQKQSLQETLDTEYRSFVSEPLLSEELKSISVEIEEIEKSLTEIQTKINELNDFIEKCNIKEVCLGSNKPNNDKLRAIRSEYAEIKAAYIAGQYDHDQLLGEKSDEINKLNKQLKQLSDELSKVEELDNKAKASNYRRSMIEKDQQNVNENIELTNNKIGDLQKQIDDLNFDVNEFEKLKNNQIELGAEKEKLVKKVAVIEQQVIPVVERELDQLQQELENCQRYSGLEVVDRLYKDMIYSQNFIHVLFEYYMIFLNNTLNLLLEDVPFKLQWTDGNSMQMVTIVNGEYVYQDSKQASGMETTFLGLALLYTIHVLNIQNSVNVMFIDEISGTLNNGANLSYDAENYQELFVKILSKFTDKSIFIIDHTIDDIKQNVTYEVIPNEEHTCSKFVRR